MVAALLAVYKQSASSNRALTLGAATLSGKYVAVLTSVPILPPKVGRQRRREAFRRERRRYPKPEHNYFD